MSSRPRPSSASALGLPENGIQGESHIVNTLNLEHGDSSDQPTEEIQKRMVSQGNVLGDFGFVDAEGIYAAVRCGLCINEVINPISGDTLLHAAAKQDSPELAIALLQCGADTRLRNRLGRCPMDDAGSSVAAILKIFHPCLPEAIDTANASALRHLCHSLWANVHAVLRNGQNSLQIASGSRLSNANKCLRILNDFAPLSLVVHALMACDVSGLNDALRQGGFLPPQDADHLHKIRQCPAGPDGRTLVAVALDRGDVQSARLLLDAGASSRGRQIAFSANLTNDVIPDSPVTTSQLSKPLAWSVLRNADVGLGTSRGTAMFSITETPREDTTSLSPSGESGEASLDLILEYDPVALLTQRDSYSNTTLHAALARNCELSKLTWLIERRPALLAERNAQAQCVRELAATLYRQDALRLFEQVVKESIGQGRNSLIAMLACRGHGDCCLKPTRILAEDARSQSGELAAVAQQRGSDLEKSLLCSDVGLSRIESIGRDHLRACADGNLKMAQKTNFAAFQEASTGCTGLIAAIAGEHLDVVSYLLATRGTELTRMADNAGRYPLHYVYALMQQNTPIASDDIEPQSRTPRDEEVTSKPHMAMARLISKCDVASWSLEDSLGRKPIDMAQLGQSPEAKNMLWAGWMAGRSTSAN